jgi:UDP-glucose 4-epimerase
VCPISSRRIPIRAPICVAAALVIEGVKHMSGADFKVEHAPRRAGDPAQIFAARDLIRSTLGWQPCFGDLQTMVTLALAWNSFPRGVADRR